MEEEEEEEGDLNAALKSEEPSPRTLVPSPRRAVVWFFAMGGNSFSLLPSLPPVRRAPGGRRGREGEKEAKASLTRQNC